MNENLWLWKPSLCVTFYKFVNPDSLKTGNIFSTFNCWTLRKTNKLKKHSGCYYILHIFNVLLVLFLVSSQNCCIMFLFYLNRSLLVVFQFFCCNIHHEAIKVLHWITKTGHSRISRYWFFRSQTRCYKGTAQLLCNTVDLHLSAAAHRTSSHLTISEGIERCINSPQCQTSAFSCHPQNAASCWSQKQQIQFQNKV